MNIMILKNKQVKGEKFMSVINVTNENFNEIISNEKKVLIDFYATWCGPCRMLSPIVDQFAEENPQYVVGKINVDDCEDIARKYGIQSIPTLIVFQNGEAVKQSLGVITKEQIANLLS